jgi:uncharacterized membrane protein YgaE (UPF0421/DUF939 family)
VVQASAAAAAAWVIATRGARPRPPFLAPVAAIVILGLTNAERGRRAVEVAIGVAEAAGTGRASSRATAAAG